MSNTTNDKCNAVVALVTAIACFTWCLSANAFSKARTLGPAVNQPDVSGSFSACHSSSPVTGNEIGIILFFHSLIG